MAIDTIILAAFAISLSPGPGAVASLSSGLRFGFARGYWNAVGLAIGYAIQYLISIIGVGAILASSQTAFLVVKWIGIAYLFYLGIKQLRAPVAIIKVNGEQSMAMTRRQLILQGMLVNLTNPKGAVFLIAVTPQFIIPQAPLLPQYISICLILVLADMIVMAGYTGLAAKIMQFMRNPHHAAKLNKIFGLLFIAAAILMAWMGK